MNFFTKATSAIVGLVVGLWMLAATLFIVYPWESALVLQFGEVVGTRRDAGIYFKMPWQDVLRFDSRILTIDTKDPDRFLTAEKENVLVDSYIKWRIIDPRQYYVRVGGVENNAAGRLLEIINRGLRDEFGKRTVNEVVSGDREEVMRIIRERANSDAEDIGVQVSDVRVKRVELPTNVSQDVYNNMIAERRRIANERRSTGDAEKEKISATADKDRTIILAEAVREADTVKGVGDARAAAIYAGAFSRYADFYAFHRALQAYRRALGSGRDFLVLDPESDFFRYLKQEDGKLP
jgi:membrane protease subunit HflC